MEHEMGYDPFDATNAFEVFFFVCMKRTILLKYLKIYVDIENNFRSLQNNCVLHGITHSSNILATV